MKSSIKLPLVTLLILVSLLYAVKPAAAEVHGGVLVGGSLSWLGDTYSSERYADVSEGAFLSFSVGSRITIQPSIVLSRRGGTYPRWHSYPSGELAEFDGADIRIDYYEFPLLVRYCIDLSNCVRPELIMGPAWCSIRRSSLQSRSYTSGEWARGHDTALIFGFGFSSVVKEAIVGIDVLYRASLSSPSEQLLFPEGSVEGASILVRIGI